MRSRGVIAAAALLALSPLSTAAHLLSPASAAACPALRVTGKWTTSDFPLPATSYNQLVRDPRNPKLLFATDGNSIVRSTDQGCAWASVFGHSLPDTSAAPDGPTTLPTGYYVSAIAATGGPDVYATLAPTALSNTPAVFGPTPLPVLLLASSDGGASFSLRTPSPTQPRCLTSSLAVSLAAPKTVYLDCYGAVVMDSFVPLPPVGPPLPVPVPLPQNAEPVSNLQDVFYVSTDGGAGWERRLQKGVPTSTHGITELFADPYNPAELWARVALNAAAQTIVVIHSTDSAKTWTVAYQGQAVTGVPTMNGLSFLHPKKTARALLVAWGPAGAVATTDGGRTWVPLPTPAGGLYAATFDATGGRVAVTYSTGASCAGTAKLYVFDTKKLRKPLAVSAVTVNPSSSNLNVASLAKASAAAGSFSTITRIYQQAGSVAGVVACTLPGSPPPPPPAPPVTTGTHGPTWTNVIATYRG